MLSIKSKSRRRSDWDAWIRALALIHIGMQLGTVSPLSQATHDIIEALCRIVR